MASLNQVAQLLAKPPQGRVTFPSQSRGLADSKPKISPFSELNGPILLRVHFALEASNGFYVCCSFCSEAPAVSKIQVDRRVKKDLFAVAADLRGSSAGRNHSTMLLITSSSHIGGEDAISSSCSHPSEA